MSKSKKKSTFDRLMSNSERRKSFDKGYNDFLLSEIIAESMQSKHLSVRTLARQSGLSPTIIQEIKSGKKKNLTLGSVSTLLSNLDIKLVVKSAGKEYALV